MHPCPIEDILEQQGLRKTQDRHAVLELFVQNRAWTAAQIHEQLSEMNLSTVYRNLRTLEKNHLIEEISLYSGETTYEKAGQKHHDHQLCRSCKTMQCIPCPVEGLAEHRLELVADRCCACTKRIT
ncbi:MAG TPA: transcriptional repressor [Patescibacteria group bacterium]|nr:transcriptional repressor [Patescibacteria group bacterium]